MQPLALAVLPGLLATIEADAGGGGMQGEGVRWPPMLHELPLSQLHQQAQPLVRHLVQVRTGRVFFEAALIHFI